MEIGSCKDRRVTACRKKAMENRARWGSECLRNLISCIEKSENNQMRQ